MATRYYPVTLVPNVEFHGVNLGTWAGESWFSRTYAPVQWTWRLAQAKNTGTQGTQNLATNQQGNFDVLLARWVTPPLQAQALSGTIQFCFGVQAVWDDPSLGNTNDSIVRYKLHVYLANGQTAQLRTTLVNNHIDSVDFPGTAGQVWRSLAVAQSLAAASALDGDVIVIEIGTRIVSSPTPAPQYFPTDTGMTRITWRSIGASSTNADAVAGDTATNRAPWFEFSMNLAEQAASAPPANDACVDAIVIASLPYSSGGIDTTGSLGTDREVWWTWTAPTDGKVFFDTRGGNYFTEIAILFDNGGGLGCGSLQGVNFPNFPVINTQVASHRSQSSLMVDVLAGTQYWIRVRNFTSAFNAPNSGGLCVLNGRYVDRSPQPDDLYLVAGDVCALRDGVIINFNAAFSNSAPTGITIDYTQRSMDDLNGGTHAGERILLGLHNFELVEILDLPTLSYGDNQSEIDFIGDPWFVTPENQHPAQLHCTRDGTLYVGWFGNGYLYILGGGTLPAVLNTVSNNADFSALKSIDATHGDNQPGAPFSDTLQFPAIEVCAPWAITIDESNNILYYTSGGFYVPVGGQQIKRFNLTSNTQMPDFATVALQGTNNPGLKGLRVLADGQVLVCNGTVIERYSSGGVLVMTYTPSIPEDAQSLCDVCVTSNGAAFWAVDEVTTRIYKFDIATGAELFTTQPYLRPGTLVQMALYAPNPTGGLPNPCPLEWIPETVPTGTACRSSLLP